MEKTFTGYIRGKLNNEVIYKCFFKSIDSKGFTSISVEYLKEEDFRKLPKLKK